MEEYGGIGYYCPNCGHRGWEDSDLLPGTPGYAPGEVRVECSRCGEEIVGKVIQGWISQERDGQ